MKSEAKRQTIKMEPVFEIKLCLCVSAGFAILFFSLKFMIFNVVQFSNDLNATTRITITNRYLKFAIDVFFNFSIVFFWKLSFLFWQTDFYDTRCLGNGFVHQCFDQWLRYLLQATNVSFKFDNNHQRISKNW